MVLLGFLGGEAAGLKLRNNRAVDGNVDFGGSLLQSFNQTQPNQYKSSVERGEE